MSAGEPLSLQYESGVAGALEPGEHVVWEGRPDASRVRESWMLRGMLVAVITFMVCVAAASVTSDAILTLIAGLASVIFVGGAMLLAGSGDAKKRREVESLVYRITDRRVMRLREEPVRLVTQSDIEELHRIRVEVRRSGDATVGVDSGVSLSHVCEPHDLVARLLDVVRQSERRPRLRRSPTSITNEALMPAAAPPNLPPGIALAKDEAVLWVGRPSAKQRYDRAWLLGLLPLLAFTGVAAYWLLASLGMVRWPFGRVPWWIGVVAALFLIGFLKSLLITPFQDAARRRRTTYVLTNVRGIVHLAGRTAVTDSFLLDMCGTATLSEREDGSGSVRFGFSGPFFQRVENVSAVHQMALEAIRRAGTPITPPRGADGEDELM